MAQVSDNGFLNGLANGIKEGLLTYQTTANIKHQQQMQELMSGVQKDDQGNMQLSPELQAHKQAGLINDQQTIAANDPGSEHSQRLASVRGTFAHAGDKNIPVNAYSGLSASEQKDIDPYGKANISGTYGLLGQQAKAQGSVDAAGVRVDGAVKKASTVSNKDWGKLTDALDPNKARGGNLAKSQGVINSAERLEGVFQQFPDGNIPKAQTTELATGIAGLVSGGSPQSQHQIDQIVPSSLRGDWNGIASWFVNEPQGQEQQSFIKVLQDSSAREKAIAQGQVRKAQTARLAQFDYLAQASPDKYKKILSGYGLSPEPAGDVGADMPPPGQSGGLIGSPPQGQGAPPPDAAAKLKRLQELKAKAAM